MDRLRLTLIILLTAYALPLSAAAPDSRPNIIFMLADDQSWSGLSVAMHPDVPGSKGRIYQTPQLEKFAAQGMRFSAAYAPASVCSPTRISLQTGLSPAALHWTKAAPAETGRKLIEPRLIKRISADQTTIGEMLRQAGYATAHYGKWHISGGGPEAHGYDESDGDTGNKQAFQFKDPNPADIFGMAERAEAFMEKCTKESKPFYIQLSWNALHASENALTATLEKYKQLMPNSNSKRVSTAAMTENLDTGVGRVLAAIDRLGLADNTYVIYTSDNGGGGGKDALHGGKGSLWEGGIRSPLIIRGPGIKPNSWCHTRVVGYDFFPTFCDWAGVDPSTLPKTLEGGSIAPLLIKDVKGEVKRPREEMVFHFPHYQGDAPHSAIFLGNLKLIKFYEDDRVMLFDLSSDIRERNDLSQQMPDEAKKLREQLEAYLTSVNAQLPTVNSNYDPSRPAPQRERRGGGGRNNERPSRK